jgi:hypothetical protein
MKLLLLFQDILILFSSVGLADRAFLKAQVFKLLHVECLDPDRGDDMKAFWRI